MTTAMAAEAAARLQATSELFTVALIVAAVIVTVTTVLSRRGETLATSQDMTIASLQGSLAAVESDGRLKDEQLAAVTRERDTYRAQVALLSEQVKQVAKVDELRTDLTDAYQALTGHHTHVAAVLERIERHLAAREGPPPVGDGRQP